RMCETLNYYSLVISMKSSNPQVMVQAYRLLVETMTKEGMNYPLHLGVTEAGDGEDGRIKSAVGIGTLLEDGLGDTVRVSLTEDPEFEAPVATALVKRYEKRKSEVGSLKSDLLPPTSDLIFPPGFSPYEYQKRHTVETNVFIGGHQVPRVVCDLSKKDLKDPKVLKDTGYDYSLLLDKYNMGEQSVDFVYLGDSLPSFSMPGNLKQLYNYKIWKEIKDKTNCHPLLGLKQYLEADIRDSSLNLVRVSNADLQGDDFNNLQLDKTLVFVLETNADHGMADQRMFFFKMLEAGIDVPVIIKRSYPDSEFGGNMGDLMDPEEPVSKLQLYAATDLGGLLIDGFGDGIWIDVPALPTNILVATSFGVLQATRSRISKTEYISCPSCGRTLFDLQETTAKIRTVTDHLKGIKIGIMGCIVNGPGEMADADYGYVGLSLPIVTSVSYT
ncbi:MAG TPA: 1-hydroxy-2-methyl-2-(E)-butenyl 4-diphosphate synthase, partial [Sphingobacteriaceae bacterium]|nr:1-hydroxy-2-methyl-2-(E)-butenyl 4-diphosphate synthase [Sphingobacteriaceae bacterium]